MQEASSHVKAKTKPKHVPSLLGTVSDTIPANMDAFTLVFYGKTIKSVSIAALSHKQN